MLLSYGVTIVIINIIFYTFFFLVQRIQTHYIFEPNRFDEEHEAVLKMEMEMENLVVRSIEASLLARMQNELMLILALCAFGVISSYMLHNDSRRSHCLFMTKNNKHCVSGDRNTVKIGLSNL